MHPDAANPDTPVFETQRMFKAPLARVWQAWSRIEQFGLWWGPKGCAIDMKQLDFRPGGFCHYAMTPEGAPTMWGRFLYREIAPHGRIVWLNGFSNPECGIARAPFSDLCPLEIENTATFAAQGDATLVTLHARPFGATAPERAFFAELCDTGSLAQGYGGTLDQLADHLSAHAAD